MRQFRSDSGRFLKGHMPPGAGVRNPCYCKECGVEFYPADYVKRVYCSCSCYKSGRFKNYRGEGHHLYKKEKQRVFVCGFCNQEFVPRSHGNVNKFCSNTCFAQYNSGENNANWKGGISSENHKIRSSQAYNQWRMSVLQRDRFSCVNCGYRSRGKKSRDVVVDHKKPFSLFPELRFVIDNGRTLCRNCDAVLGWNYNREKGTYHG